MALFTLGVVNQGRVWLISHGMHYLSHHKICLSDCVNIYDQQKQTSAPPFIWTTPNSDNLKEASPHRCLTPAKGPWTIKWTSIFLFLSHTSRQINVIPKLELIDLGVDSDSLTKRHFFGVTNRRFGRYNLRKNVKHPQTQDIQIPPEEVFRVCFGGPNTFSGGVWSS